MVQRNKRGHNVIYTYLNAGNPDHAWAGAGSAGVWEVGWRSLCKVWNSCMWVGMYDLILSYNSYYSLMSDYIMLILLHTKRTCPHAAGRHSIINACLCTTLYSKLRPHTDQVWKTTWSLIGAIYTQFKQIEADFRAEVFLKSLRLSCSQKLTLLDIHRGLEDIREAQFVLLCGAIKLISKALRLYLRGCHMVFLKHIVISTAWSYSPYCGL